MPSNMVDTITVVDPTSRAGAEVKYGPYYNQMPEPSISCF
jgi:oligosaccharyltransferase complex subunit alpha (ribophorin I)